MKYQKPALENHLLSNINKPEMEQPEVLLKTMNLLNSGHIFIEITSLKNSENTDLKGFQVFNRLTYLSTWLGHVTMLFLGLINKNKTYFLISRNLAISHSNSYLIAHSNL